MPPPGFTFDSPAAAIDAILEHVRPVSTERVPLDAAPGRVLAQEVGADRPSPACDVSAMDGFAVRVAEARGASLPVAGEARIGRPPGALPSGAAVRIVTGAPLPSGADAVIKREDVTEREGRIEIDPDAARSLRPGDALRRMGENAPPGKTVLTPGRLIAANHAAALASFGSATPLVHRRVRVAILVTGDELLPVDSTPQAWELRDSNGPALSAMLATLPFVEAAPRRHAPDDLDLTTSEIRDAVATADLVFITGGVSMGDRDYVPRALQDLGARTIFHKLPQRPGKPVLAAVFPGGVPVMALPGNPVSVLVTARRIGMPVLRRLAGFQAPKDVPPLVTLAPADTRTIDLWWHRPVQVTGPNRATLIANMGSGDVAGVAASDGFVEVPPGQSGAGPWPYFCWRA